MEILIVVAVVLLAIMFLSGRGSVRLHNHKNHGPACNARTRPTRCRRCHEDIFFFTCDCGSRVLFDELGDSWTKHHCR